MNHYDRRRWGKRDPPENPVISSGAVGYIVKKQRPNIMDFYGKQESVLCEGLKIVSLN